MTRAVWAPLDRGRTKGGAPCGRCLEAVAPAAAGNRSRDGRGALRGSFSFNCAWRAVSDGARARRLRPSGEEAGGPCHLDARICLICPRGQHLSQREVGAGTVADAVGERRDPHRVSSNLLCLGVLPARPSTGRARCARGTARARRTTTPRSLQAARTCPPRRSRLVEQEVGKQRGLRGGMRDAIGRPQAGRWSRRKCAFATSRLPASASTSIEQWRPGRQQPDLVADLLVERAGVRQQD